VGGGAGAGFCHTLASFLAGEPVIAPPKEEQTTGAPTGLVTTAAATDDTTAGLDHLLALLRAPDLVVVVDLPQSLTTNYMIRIAMSAYAALPS
jgi:hypothetical protein